MGIRGLHTFAIKNVRCGFRSVDLEEEARNYQRVKECKPILVIELSAFHVYVYEGDYEKLLGGRFEIFNERLHKMLSKLRSLGFEMVFFIKGTSSSKKTIKEREDTYLRGVTILHAIDEGLDLSGDLSEYNIKKMGAFYGNLIHISREYGEVRVAVVNDCHKEMVRLANERDALAIVSNDSELLIFDGRWRFWRDLNFNENTATEYNKAALRRHLGLSQPQMVLFASLAGNKIISQELLNTFHNLIHKRKFFASSKEKIDKIAEYVKRLPSSIQNGDIMNLAKRIFQRVDWDQGMEALQESINFYCLIGMQDNSDDFLTRLAEECPRFVYRLLKNDSIIISYSYSDLSKTIFPPYFDFFKPLLCRLMGVLFWQQEKRDFSKIFYFKLEHSQPFTSVELHAIYPSGNVPPLQDLLLAPYGENEGLDKRRWELLCFMISPKLKTDVLRSVPGFYLATYATLFFLVTENLIQVDEADCILISCEGRKPLPELQNEFTFEKVKKIDGRDARTAFVFLRVMRNIIACFSVVGLKNYAGLITFDGLCFHNLRKVWGEIDNGQLDSVREELQQFRIYAQV